MRLTIVIPALNEEQAIASIIERCLDARAHITLQSPVGEVEIIVVSDGSTDRTAEIAAGYPEIRLIVFEENRGYGAAIKTGFEAGSGELVGFLDADGTCDPLFFANLCTALHDNEADVALGSRMGPRSRMPAVRRFGNRVYALVLGLLSNRTVTDTASGMRVIRRDVLHRLYPLPDGLDFTPAMSARVLMDEHLRIVERPMAYEERIGRSKLNVFRDGVRFFQTIFEMTLMWRPARLFAAGAAFCLLAMAALVALPLELWLRQAWFPEDMIYRVLLSFVFGTVGVSALSASVLADLLHRLLDRDRPPPTFVQAALHRTYSAGGLAVAAALALPVVTWLVGGGLVAWFGGAPWSVHWSRVVLAGLVCFGLVQHLLTVMLARIIQFHIARASLEVPDRQSAASVLADLPSYRPSQRPETEHLSASLPSPS